MIAASTATAARESRREINACDFSFFAEDTRNWAEFPEEAVPSIAEYMAAGGRLLFTRLPGGIFRAMWVEDGAWVN